MKSAIFGFLTIAVGLNSAPTRAAGPMPLCLGHAISTAEKVVPSTQNAIWDDINNVLITQSDSEIVWGVVLKERASSSVRRYRIALTKSDCSAVSVSLVSKGVRVL